MKIEKVKINEIKEYQNNAKEHPKEQIEQIKKSIKDYGFNDPIAIDENNMIIEGHGRLIALKELGEKQVDCIRLSHLTEEQKKSYILIHNKLTMNTDFDMDKLKQELDDSLANDIDLSFYDFNLDEILLENEEYKAWTEKMNYGNDPEKKGNLIKKFLVPPFSVIQSNKNPWLEKKIKWKEYFKSFLGREKDLIDAVYGTCVFDGTISEIFYQWLKPQGISNREYKILDCFSGGVIRGAIADKLGFSYTGFDIREEQIKANNLICKDLGLNPKYICDDSRNLDKYDLGEDFDLLFSCPPYGDLEVYSNLDGDISNKDYNEFLEMYKEIIHKSLDKLKNNRFAVFVVGEIRDKKGAYRGFIKDTIESFLSYSKENISFYNEIIFIDNVTTASIRCGKIFNSSRKITKVHQNILVFYKGDLKKIKDVFGKFYTNEELEEIEIENIED